MALLTNSCETGLANGTGLTAANSDDASAGSAWSTSIPGTSATSTCVYSTAQKAHGSLAYLFTTVSGDSSFIQWTVTAAGSLAFRFYFRPTTTPSAHVPIVSVRSSSAQRFAVMHGSDGILKVLDGANANKTTAWSAISLNAWVRIEGVITKGTGPTDGRIQVKYFTTLDSTSPTGTYDTVSAGHTADTGTVDFTQVRFGRPSGVTTAATQVYYMDDFAAQDSTSFLGPVGVNILPTVTPTASTVYVVKNALGGFSWTGNDPDGTIGSYTVTHISGPDNPSLSSPTTTSRTATYTTQGTHVYEVYATDNAPAAGDPATITVHVTDVTSDPMANITNTGPWTNQGGAASITAALADASDATYAQTPTDPSGAILTESFKPLGDGPVTVTTRDSASAASPAITRTVELLQGTTVIATGVPFVLSTTVTNHTLTTTSGETAAITDRSALRVRVTDTV